MNLELPEPAVYIKSGVLESSKSKDDHSDEAAQSTISSDSLMEKALVRKCDLHVIPVIALLYMLAFVDRINIGNARIQGLEKELHMHGSDYNIALFVFFIPYILFEVPSNLLIRRIKPSTWLSFLMICWGKTSHSAFRTSS